MSSSSSAADLAKRPSLWSHLNWQSLQSQSTLPRHSPTATVVAAATATARHRRTSSLAAASSPWSSFASTPEAKYHPHQQQQPSARQPAARFLGIRLMLDPPHSMYYRQRLRYLRAGAVIALVVLAVYWFLPRDRQKFEDYVESHTPAFAGGSSSKSPAAFDDSLAAQDPGTSTSRCTKPYSLRKPLVQYVLMVDAGSTGSRIHVYKFNNCGPTPELEQEVFEQTAKREGGSGLGSYGEDAEAAAQSLDALLATALRTVPGRLKACTPIAVKATAGLRKLGNDLSNRILQAVRHRLETDYPFPVVSHEQGGVEVMDGKYEGVYAWITTNYLLGKIGGPDDDSPTAAVFDLGGGSTQIVFEPNYRPAVGGGMPQQLAQGDHKYDLDFGGRHFALYQHSYLGYGLMAARNNMHALVIDAMHRQHGSADQSWLAREIVNPCLVPGMSRSVQVELAADHALGSSVTVRMAGPKDGSTSQCQAIAEKTLRKDAECKLAPCAFNGVHQPSLSKTFAREDVYLFSYFYDRIKPLGVPENFTLRDLKELAHRVCQGPVAWDAFESIDGALAELRDRPETCLDLNFFFVLLHLGYEMPLDREVKIAKKIKGNELGWCLGASLPLLEQSSGWQCKIHEV